MGMTRDPHYDELLRRRGRIAEIAAAVGLSKQAVSAWQRIPAERAPAIAAALRLPLSALRPDLWPPRDTP
jgi:DNA-binding transcriptional regulator YdaS (Cro superfamily)